MFGLFNKKITYKLSWFTRKVGEVCEYGNSDTEAAAVSEFINDFDIEICAGDMYVYLSKLENNKVISVEDIPVKSFKARFGVEHPEETMKAMSTTIVHRITNILNAEFKTSKYSKMYKATVKIESPSRIKLFEIDIFDLRKYYNIEDVRDWENIEDFYNNDFNPMIKRIEMKILKEFRGPEIKVTSDGDWDDQTVMVENFSTGVGGK